MTFKNRFVVITGASDGIGFGIARAFAQQGAHLCLIARAPTKLEKAREQLAMNSGNIHLISADLTTMTDMHKVITTIQKHTTQVDVLVNNAGIGRFVPFLETDEQLFDEHIQLNIKGPYFLTQKLLPLMSHGGASVINISSYFANRMLEDRTATAYALTKGAINSFTKSLAFEVGKKGIRVNAIAPGTIHTQQMENNLQQLSTEQQENFKTMIPKIYPLGCIGNIDDVGQMAVFLASNQAKWVTGAVFPVDGGLTTN